MPSRDPTAWMWAEACHMIEQAERLHRQFFRLGTAGRQAAWEPPVDVLEDEARIAIAVALPGVPPDRIEVVIDGGSLLVRARCELPFRGSALRVRRLEIPHGWFERRIDLPDVRLELAPPQSLDGLLIINLRKVSARA